MPELLNPSSPENVFRANQGLCLQWKLSFPPDCLDVARTAEKRHGKSSWSLGQQILLQCHQRNSVSCCFTIIPIVLLLLSSIGFFVFVFVKQLGLWLLLQHASNLRVPIIKMNCLLESSLSYLSKGLLIWEMTISNHSHPQLPLFTCM